MQENKQISETKKIYKPLVKKKESRSKRTLMVREHNETRRRREEHQSRNKEKMQSAKKKESMKA